MDILYHIDFVDTNGTRILSVVTPVCPKVGEAVEFGSTKQFFVRKVTHKYKQGVAGRSFDLSVSASVVVQPAEDTPLVQKLKAMFEKIDPAHKDLRQVLFDAWLALGG